MAPQPLRLFALQATDEFGAAVAAGRDDHASVENRT